MNDWIDSEKNKIVSRMNGMTLLDTEIDLSNISHLIVAAYHLGRIKGFDDGVRSERHSWTTTTNTKKESK